MSKATTGVNPSMEENASDLSFGLDALLEAVVLKLITIVSQAFGVVSGQHAFHVTQLSALSPGDATSVVRGLGMAALKAAKEHAGTVRMTPASAARELRGATATFANALVKAMSAHERDESFGQPGLYLVMAAVRLRLALTQYGEGLFTVNEPKARKLRSDGVVTSVKVTNLSVNERALVIKVADADETSKEGAIQALCLEAAHTGSVLLQQVSAMIIANDHKGLNTLYTKIRRAGMPDACASAPETADPSMSSAHTLADEGAAVFTLPQSPGAEYPASERAARVDKTVATMPLFLNDGTDARVAKTLVAWLESSGQYIAHLLQKLPDGIILRTETARSAGVNANFDRAGRHPDVQAALRALLASQSQR